MTLIFPLIEDRENLIIVESASELLHSILKLSKD